MSRFGSKYGGGSGGRGGRSWGEDPRQPWWRRIFAQGDNPMTWSAPIGSLAGITIRVSLIYIIWMVIELLSAHDWTFKAWSVASLFVLVLLHEFGHCFACRRVGGEADNILMWMLGGLAYCRSPHTWRANLVTTAGGPMVNVVLVPVFMGVLMALGAPLGSLLFNPFGSGVGFAWLRATESMHCADWMKTPLFSLHVTNLALLLFNVLLPMFPMDGGRLLQCLLWRKLGYSKSMWIATRIGLVAAILVGLFGAFVQSWTLLALAIMCGLTCYNQQQQLRFMAADDVADERWSQWGSDGDGWKLGKGGASMGKGDEKSNAKRAEKATKAAQAERDRQISETAELDRILAKIKDKGMASLSKSEQAFLRRSTERSRGA